MTANTGGKINNCSELCAYQRIPPGYIDLALGPTYYAKCYAAKTSSPMNSRRIAFPSQLGTVEIDPSLPSINAVNHSCVRMKHFENFDRIRNILVTACNEIIAHDKY